MKSFPKVINTKQDVLNLVVEFPDQIKLYVKNLLDERMYYNENREWVENSNAKIFRMGFTLQEAINLLGEYTEVTIPSPPPTQEEREATELIAWRATADCSRLQAILALEEVGLYDSIKSWIDEPLTPKVIKLAFYEAYRFSRNSELFNYFKTEFTQTDVDIDNLFKLAQTKIV